MQAFFFFKWKENIVLIRVRSTISVGGARALDEVCTYFAPSTQSSSAEKNPLYDCVGWLFSQLEHAVDF